MGGEALRLSFCHQIDSDQPAQIIPTVPSLFSSARAHQAQGRAAAYSHAVRLISRSIDGRIRRVSSSGPALSPSFVIPPSFLSYLWALEKSPAPANPACAPVGGRANLKVGSEQHPFPRDGKPSS
jgi:hypothetical protein